ncbi:ribonuclease HI family protein [Staphylococcus pasteuri]|uniref:Ribonuclease HI n=2 Tax=Staphylococcus TaxID=1279 RepID=A0ABY1H449_9STAP|nr:MULTISPECIES: ribonuclease HI family protein [Staphylococcus]ODB78219.1 ribonuclease H [Staphylococcus sp. AOAB]RQX29054.1 ribonuclease HI family protein [Staphylococcus warneri]ATH62639.1 ribonuclease H [Staphylococcus pasteuri]KKI57374.1 Ribonuclease HI [Staphylococcus pasteuri]MBL3397805.1 ribonuclease HI family protein [Staphylococcus pasteuri]
MAKINFDAATKGNPGMSTCAIVIKEDDQHHIFTHELGEMDNHSAEWAACIHALEHARELKVSNALLYTDSKLIADSVDAGYIKNAKFKPYFEQLELLERDFELLFVKWVPREQNKEANQHAQQALFKLLKRK